MTMKYKFQKYHQNHGTKTYFNIALHVVIIDSINYFIIVSQCVMKMYRFIRLVQVGGFLVR